MKLEYIVEHVAYNTRSGQWHRRKKSFIDIVKANEFIAGINEKFSKSYTGADFYVVNSEGTDTIRTHAVIKSLQLTNEGIY
jgi:hypothetical protein